MDIGISVFPTEETIDVVDLASEVEERGFESLWLTEHTHIPVRRDPESPAGGDLADFYARTLDPFVGLTAAAMATSRIRLGFGIMLLVQREPIATAKALASLDRVSGGRLICGVGAGWIPEEIANHGTVPSTRFKVLHERVLAMREIWTEDEAEFHGDFVDFDPIWSWPKPLQTPFPLYIGGNTINTLRRVIEAGEGWFPVGNDAASRPQLIQQIAGFRQMCEEAGRGHLPVTIYGPEPSAEALDELRVGGVDRVVLTLSQDSANSARADLDRFERLMD
jgi:probable F420-dependent oxidoreductase